MKHVRTEADMAAQARALGQRNKSLKLYLDISCKLCVNYPCFEGIDNIESNFANTCVNYSVTKKDNSNE